MKLKRFLGYRRNCWRCKEKCPQANGVLVKRASAFSTLAKKNLGFNVTSSK